MAFSIAKDYKIKSVICVIVTIDIKIVTINFNVS